LRTAYIPPCAPLLAKASASVFDCERRRPGISAQKGGGVSGSEFQTAI
jgi:hypothetical protein